MRNLVYRKSDSKLKPSEYQISDIKKTICCSSDSFVKDRLEENKSIDLSTLNVYVYVGRRMR
jgi:hypothetical protein